MKILLYGVGTKGDINPLIGLAMNLASRNHDCTILTSEQFSNEVTQSNIKFFPVGTIDEYLKGNSNLAWSPNSKNSDNFEYYHAPCFERAFKYTQDVIHEGPTLVISLSNRNGAAVAAQKFGAALVLVKLAPCSIFSYISPPAPLCWKIPKLTPSWIKKIALQKMRKTELLTFYKSKEARKYMETRAHLGAPFSLTFDDKAILEIAFFPEWFGMRAKDWPSKIKCVGFPLFDPPKKTEQSIIDEFITTNGPPLVFTTGTGVPDASELFHIGMKICLLLQLPGVFVGKTETLQFENTTPAFLFLDYADFADLLPRSKAIVHHGGIGTTAQAIRAKIPQLIRPIKYDQPDNAWRIHKLQLGTILFPERFTPEVAAELLTKLISHHKKNHKTVVYAEDIKSSCAFERAGNLIDQIIDGL